MKERYGVEAELIGGSNGIFDVTLDGSLIFSKDKVGRFPNPNEVFDQIDEAS